MRRLGIVGGSVSLAVVLTSLGVLLHGIGQGDGNEALAGALALVGCLVPGAKEWLTVFRPPKPPSEEPEEPVPKPSSRAVPIQTRRRVLQPDGDDYWPRE